MTTITREQALKIIEAADEVISALAGTNEDVHPGSDNMLRLWDDLNDRYAPPEVVRELARIALASLEAEPIGEVSEKRHGLVMDGTVDLVGTASDCLDCLLYRDGVLSAVLYALDAADSVRMSLAYALAPEGVILAFRKHTVCVQAI